MELVTPVICIIFAKLSRNRPGFRCSQYQMQTVSVWSLWKMVVLHLASWALRGKGKEPRLQIGSRSPPVLQSTLPRTVIHFSSCVPSLCLSFFFPPSSHQCISLPMWCLHVAMHLRAVCGIVLWAGIWQRLIRERMSCAIPSELI